MQKVIPRSQQELEQNHEQFQSISSHQQQPECSEPISSSIPIQPQKPYTSTAILFPQPLPITSTLFNLYQQNSLLINNLKQQLARLKKIKKQNIYIKHTIPKFQLDEQPSQCFLKSQQVYEERQQERKKLKRQIISADSQQMKTLMAKNASIKSLSKKYFELYKKIIDVKLSQNHFILLTQENKFKRKPKQQSLQNLRQTTSPQKNTQVQTTENINLGQKSSQTKQIKKQQKIKYHIRMIPKHQIFPQLINEKSQILQTQLKYHFSLSPQKVPVAISFDNQRNVFLVCLKHGQILCLKPNDHSDSASQNKAKQQGSHKNEEISSQKLHEIKSARIQLSEKTETIFCEVRNSQLFIITSDFILRIYEPLIDQSNTLSKYKLKKVIYCLHCNQQLSTMKNISFSSLNQNEILFTGDQQYLCKLNINKYKTQILHKFEDKILDINQSYIQTQSCVYFNYLESIESKNLAPIDKKTFSAFSAQPNVEQVLKYCSFEKQGTLYLARVERHGQFSGFVIESQLEKEIEQK